MRGILKTTAKNSHKTTHPTYKKWKEEKKHEREKLLYGASVSKQAHGQEIQIGS